MNIKQVVTLATVLLAVPISAFASTSNPSTDTAKLLKELHKQNSQVLLDNPQPPEPNTLEDNRTLNGVDINNNGVPDRAECVIWQALSFPNTTSKQDYDRYMALAKLFIIPPKGEHRTVLEADVVCRTRKIPEDLQDFLSYGMIKTAMLNTRQRRKLYYQRVTQQWSPSGPNCDLFHEDF